MHAQGQRLKNLPLNLEILYKGGFSQTKLIDQVHWHLTLAILE